MSTERIVELEAELATEKLAHFRTISAESHPIVEVVRVMRANIHSLNEAQIAEALDANPHIQAYVYHFPQMRDRIRSLASASYQQWELDHDRRLGFVINQAAEQLSIKMIQIDALRDELAVTRARLDGAQTELAYRRHINSTR